MQRETIESAIRERADGDAAFRSALIADPATALESAFGVTIPSTLDIRIVEETADEVVLVLPAAAESRAIAEEDLNAVIGGDDSHYTCRY